MIQLSIDTTNKDPFDVQIAAGLRKAIHQAQITPGTKLPPTAQWAQAIGVDRHTLDKALVILAKEGLLWRRRNLGTFVNSILNKAIAGKRKTAKVLLLLPDRARLDYPYTQEVIRGIEASRTNYRFETEVRIADNEFLTSGALPKDMAGMIVDKEGFRELDVLKIVEACPVPVVIINSALPTYSGAATIVMDNGQGAYLATEHLIEKGHRRIAIVFRSKILSRPNWSYHTDALKAQGYQLALEKHRLENSTVYEKEGVFSDLVSIRKAGEELLRTNPRPTAILAADDLIAFELAEFFRQVGVKVPEEISLIGFHDFMQASLCRPRLTTVRTRMFALGQKAVESLLMPAVSAGVEKRPIILAVQLVARDSVAAPP